VKGKGFPYSLPSVGPGAGIGVYRQSARRWLKSSTRR